MNGSTLRWAVGSLLVVIGTMMLVVPHQFTSIAFAVIRPHLDIWGIAFLIPGFCLLAVEVLALPRPFEIASHLAAGTVLVALAYSFTLMANWPPVPNYGFLGIGTALAPFVARPRGYERIDGRGDMLPVSSGTGAAVLGLAMLLLQNQFTSPVFDSFRPHMTWLGILFLLGGTSALYVQLHPTPNRSAFVAGHFLLGVALVAFCLTSAIPLRAWLGIVYYGCFGIVIALTPWLGKLVRGIDSASLQTRLAFAFAASVGLPPIVVVGIVRRFVEGDPAATNSAWDLSFLLLIAFVVISALGGVYIADRIAAPLGTLSLAARRLAHGDTGARLPASSFTEVERLSETFGEMRDELAARAAEREKLLAEGQHRAKEMDAILNSMEEAVLVYDQNGKPVRANQATISAYGFDPSSSTMDQAMAAARSSIRHADGRPVELDELPASRALKGERIVGERFIFTDARGEDKIILVSAAPLVVGGRTDGAVVGWQDVTERERLLAAEQKARELAEKAIKVRDEFMSIAAHELKTPVTSIMGFSQLLMRQARRNNGQLDTEKVLASAEHIDEQSRRLTKLTNQLLDLSRLETGKLMLERERGNLSIAIEDLVAAIQQSHPGRVIEVRAEEVYACADVLRIEQVVTNLIDNALKFSPVERPVEVEVSKEGEDWARIAVRDYGIGIPDEKQKHIFERFYQAHTEKHYGGMGIGLSVSKQIVEMHGGTITLEKPEGEGSRFVFRLPVSGC